jgi:hypothetical protein
MIAEPLAQRLGKIRHAIPSDDTMNVKPLKQLCDAVDRFAPGLELSP